MTPPKEVGGAGGGPLTPPLGRRRNLRVMHDASIPTGTVDLEWAAHLIHRAFPPRPQEKRTLCKN